MKRRGRSWRSKNIAALILGALLCCSATAQTQDLTPAGAERAGSSDGIVPAWSGGLKAPPVGWRPEMGYVNPFPDDRPITVITRVTRERFNTELSPGLIALLDRVPGFQMPLYATRRTATYPDLTGVGAAIVPVLQPRTGEEVMRNVVQRYVGGSITREGRAYPVRANGDYYAIGTWSRRFYASHLNGAPEQLLFAAIAGAQSPASLRGNLALVHEPRSLEADKRQAWLYNAAQRRVRRAPDLAYDAVSDGSEGMLTVDQVDGFNGAMDRYDWQLLGKRVVIVPYNTYSIAEPGVKESSLIRRGSVNGALMRYERHRVWIVEATLKSGQSHVYAKRRFYVDEDSWTVLIEEAYSRRGDLWRVALHGVVQFYDAITPGIRLSVYHDLDSGSYLVSGLDGDRQPSIRFGARADFSEFAPDALRRLAR